jgi:hypothetical protein
MLQDASLFSVSTKQELSMLTPTRVASGSLPPPKVSILVSPFYELDDEKTQQQLPMSSILCAA